MPRAGLRAAYAAAGLLAAAAAQAQDAGGSRSAPIAMPRLGGQPQAAAEPSGQTGGEQRRSVEAEGTGRTETEARSSAVRAALEQVAGVYLEASSRSQLQASGSQVRDTFSENVVAHSNGFVERVTTLRSARTADGEVKVSVRADVVVNRMVEALREARLPLVPLDRDTTMVAFRTQEDRDATARQAILKYLADLTRNVEVQLGKVDLSAFAADPGLVALTAPVTFRVRADYVEKGRAVLREVATQAIEPPRGGAPAAFALCEAPRGAPVSFASGAGARASDLACRGVPASKLFVAETGGVEEKNAVLMGEGYRAFVEPRDAARLGARNAGRDVRPGVIFGVEVLDASGNVVGAAFNKAFTECDRFFTTQSMGMQDWARMGYGAHLMGGRLKPVANLFDERPGTGRNSYSPGVCVLQNARFVGSPAAAPERRTLHALLPRAAVEQAANIRVVLDWE